MSTPIKGGSAGVHLGTVIYTPKKKAALIRRRKAEEAYWRSLNGPVIVTYKEPTK